MKLFRGAVTASPFYAWVLAGGMFAAILTVPVAYGDQSNAKQDAYKQSIRDTDQHLQDIDKKLTKLQQETVKSNPDLQKKQDAFEKRVVTFMQQKGFKPEEDLKRLKELQAKLNDKSLKQDERSKLLREFLVTNTRFQQAKREAYSDPKIEAAQKKLQAEVEEGMKKKYPEAAGLLEDMKQTRQKLYDLQTSGP